MSHRDSNYSERCLLWRHSVVLSLHHLAKVLRVSSSAKIKQGELFNMTVMKRKSFKINMSTQRICDRNPEVLYWDTAAMRHVVDIHSFFALEILGIEAREMHAGKDMGGRATSEAIGWVRA